MMRMFSIMLMLAIALTTTACETLKGAGRDITNAGEAIDRRI